MEGRLYQAEREMEGRQREMEGRLYQAEREMEGRLYQVAIEGNVTSLGELIKKDAGILDRVVASGVARNNPLHVAALLGHADFVKELLTEKPEFARQLNSQGQSPLHLASAKGNVKVVKELKAAFDVCFFHDRDGRTPLHLAAVKGRVEVLKELLLDNTKSAWVLTERGEPILHLCVNHNQFKALKTLVECVKEDGFVNMKDDDDNTVLHLLAAKAQYEVIEFLFPVNRSDKRCTNPFGLEINAMNLQGSTALDVLSENCRTLSRMKINSLLKSVEPKLSREMPETSTRPQKASWEYLFQTKNDRTSESREALMVVAILIATVTFQAQMSPPGGVWQDDGHHNETRLVHNRTTVGYQKKDVRSVPHQAGQAILAYKFPNEYILFTIFNIVGFVASLILILLLVSGFSLQRKVSSWALTVGTWIAVSSMFVVYGCSFFTIAPENERDATSTPSSYAPSPSPFASDATIAPALPMSLVGCLGLIVLLALLLIAYVIMHAWTHPHRRTMRLLDWCFSKDPSKRHSDGGSALGASQGP